MATAKKVPITDPPYTIHLELSIEEALSIKALLGALSRAPEGLKTHTGNIWAALGRLDVGPPTPLEAYNVFLRK